MQFSSVSIGNAQVKFYDISAGQNQRVYVAAGDGRIYRDDDSYRNWTPIGVAESTSLTAIDVYNESSRKRQMGCIGANDSIYQRTGKQRWNEIPSPTKNGLNAIRPGDEGMQQSDTAAREERRSESLDEQSKQ